MNNDLAGAAGVWRALFEGAWWPLLLLYLCTLSSFCQRAAEDVFAVDDGSVSGDGHRFRCCTVGELLRDCDCVSVMAVREKCDEIRSKY